MGQCSYAYIRHEAERNGGPRPSMLDQIIAVWNDFITWMGGSSSPVSISQQPNPLRSRASSIQPSSIHSPKLAAPSMNTSRYSAYMSSRQPDYCGPRKKAKIYKEITSAQNPNYVQLEEKSERAKDKSAAIRVDAQPEQDEKIGAYLTRVLPSYQCKEKIPRGIVIACEDFRYGARGKDHPAVQFLEQHIKTLKEIGIKKIFVEQLVGFRFFEKEDTSSPYQLHQYFTGTNDEMPKLLEAHQLICELAKREGMEVIGAEVSVNFLNGNFLNQGNSFMTHGAYETEGSTIPEVRVRKFNGNASSLVRKVNEPFIVFAGAAHGKLYHQGEPGMADLLGCPCIGLGSQNMHEYVQPGTNRFTQGQYSVDAVFSS